ncbi:MAG TPA: hypothetical protein VJ989_11305 [Solirubrobacterales bacterium]|nr:hypothetical protein [Solirubrobacterales bacterium]
MFDEGSQNDSEDVRRKGEDRVRRKLERARRNDTHVLILALLSKAETCLTPGQIRSRLPGPRRPQRHIDYHLRALLANGLVKECGDSTGFELP